MRRNEKDFLLRKDAKYLETFKDNSERFLTMEAELSVILNDHQLASSVALKSDLIKYKGGFEQLVNGYQVLGLSDKSGMWTNYHALLADASKGVDAEMLLALDTFDEAVKAGQMIDSPVTRQYPALTKAAQAIVQQEKQIGLA
ncbi:methyl-accepting chemotaxis protein, partial [Vibrio diabolicus]|nr:methyl-accepting chemotaxis protein [Vibrio diabolicus]